MKPDWDRLAEQAHPSVFIADVNCSSEGELCDQVGVGGYPTIKVYRNDDSGKLVVEDYQGGRGFDDLMEFVETNLAVKCKVHDASNTCSPKAQDYVSKWKSRDKAKIEKERERLHGMSKNAMAPDLKGWLRERLEILAQL